MNAIKNFKPGCYVSKTLEKSLVMSINLGHDEISVLGIDDRDFISCRSNLNNHLSRCSDLYLVDKMRWKEMPETNNLDGLARGIDGHLQLLAVFFGDLLMLSKGPIVNLDENSFVDAFPKVSGNPAVTSKTNDHV